MSVENILLGIFLSRRDYTRSISINKGVVPMGHSGRWCHDSYRYLTPSGV